MRVPLFGFNFISIERMIFLIIHVLDEKKKINKGKKFIKLLCFQSFSANNIFDRKFWEIIEVALLH